MAQTPTSAPLKDPVCGMTVKPDAPHRLMHDGHEMLFCSTGCKAKFEADPAKYSKPSAKADYNHQQRGHGHKHHHDHEAHGSLKTDATAGSKWTCPMHPEIVRAPYVAWRLSP